MFQIIRYLINRKYIKKAFDFLDKGSFQKALKIFMFLKEEHGMDNYFVNLNIGRCLSGIRDFKAANLSFRRSIRQFSINPVPYVGLSRNYLLMKNNVFACKYAKKALLLDPIHPFANYYMGLCLIAMGKDSLATSYIEKAVSQNRDFFLARNAIYTEKSSFGTFGTELGEF